MAFSNRGNAYSANGDNDRAIADCSEAIRLDPKSTLAYLARGRSYYESGSEEIAKQASRRMNATSGLAAILRDALLRVAPRDEVGEKLAPRASASLRPGCDKTTRRADFRFRRRANHL